jgi:hypothetical protein
MSYRCADLNEFGDLVLRSRPGWLWPMFLGLLGTLHGTIATLAFLNGRWEAYLSAVFCLVFFTAATACRRFRTEMAVLRESKLIRVRAGVGPVGIQRYVAFGAISGVRLTLMKRADESVVELICYDDDLRCPPSHSPGQEALLLAMILDVPLTKVYGENIAPERERVNAPL